MGAKAKQAVGFNVDLFKNVIIPNKNTATEFWHKSFVPSKSDTLSPTEQLRQMENLQARQAGDLRQAMELQPKKIESDNSIPNRLRQQMALRMGMGSTITGAGSLVAPTQLKNKLGQ